MRQQTINTFDKGLNTDLNPIVTPKDVLTDCLNGAFITFNGDELTLQNDAGNTTIPIPGSDEVVKLTNGFYPIGMKEYGGVLYIVSARKGSPIDPETGEHTDPNDIDMVEFGSYPSPQYANHLMHLVKDEDVVKVKNPAKDLYLPKVINEVFFKTGGYVVFNYDDFSESSMDISNLWTPSNPTGIYKVKLYHQLSSGVYDLTEDVWDTYESFKKAENEKPGNEDKLVPEHWILSGRYDPTFRYHCPTQYKGKLAVSVELNEPPNFNFSLLPFTVLTNGEYKMSFYVDANGSAAMPINNHTNIKVSSEEETQEYVFEDFIEIRLSIDNKEFEKFDINRDVEWEELSDGMWGITSVEEYVTFSESSKTVSYEIRPKIIAETYEGEIQYYNWDTFPEPFKNKFSLSGTLLVGVELQTIYYQTLNQESREDGSTIYNTLVLSNELGPVGYNMEPLLPDEQMSVFMLEGTSVDTSKFNVLGEYTINEYNRAEYKVPDNDDYLEAFDNLIDDSIGEKQELISLIKNKVNETLVREIGVDLGTINLSLEFNVAPTKENLPTFTYTTDSPETPPIQYELDGKTCSLEVESNKNLKISFKNRPSTVLEHYIYPSKPLEGVWTVSYRFALTTEFLPTVLDNSWSTLPSTAKFYTNDLGIDNRELFTNALEGINYIPNTDLGGNQDIYLRDIRTVDSGFVIELSNPGWGSYIVIDPIRTNVNSDYINIAHGGKEFVRFGELDEDHIILEMEPELVLRTI